MSSISVYPTFDTNGNINGSTSLRFKLNSDKELNIINNYKSSKFDSIFSSLAGFCHLDSCGNFIDVSDNLLNLYCYNRLELMYYSFHIFKMQDINNDIEKIINTLQYEHPKEIETCHINKKGEKIYVKILFVRQIDSSIHCFFWDISDKKEQEIKQNNLKISAFHFNKLKNIEMLSNGVQLNFNNIITCILGFNEFNENIAQDIISDSWDLRDLSYEIISNTIEIKKAVLRTKFIFENLFSFFYLDSVDDISLVVDFNKTLENILIFIRESFLSTIDFYYDLIETKKSNFNIFISCGDLKIIILSLAINAHDSLIDRKGKITVKTRLLNQSPNILHLSSIFPNSHYVEFRHSKYDQLSSLSHMPANFLEISVHDTGVGIEKSELNSIFDSFYKFTIGDIGMGISVICDVINKSEGHIFINSAVGFGTEVRLYIPITFN